MSLATITGKGQITLPKEMRKKLHLETGEKIDFRIDEENGTAMLIPINKHVKDVFGIMGRTKNGKHVSIEDMNRAIRENFKKKFS